MAVNLSPIWGAGAQLLDNSGNVLSGGKIYTYAAGTTTQVTTFTDGSGVTAHSNPIILNSAGRVPYEIWLTDGQNYKFVLKDSNDVLIGTWDNLSGINSNFIAYTNEQEIQTATAGQTVFNLTTMNYLPGTGSLSVFVDGVNQYGPDAQYAYEETDSNTVTFTQGLHVGASVKFTSTQIQNAGVADATQISYTYPAIDAVEQSVEERLSQSISVKDFGAVGDGSTDDYNAIVDADSAAALDGKALYFPSGTYITSAMLLMSANAWYGDSDETSIVKLKSGSTVTNLVHVGPVSSTTPKTFCSIENMQFNGNVGCSDSVVKLRNVQHSGFRFIKVTGGSSDGFKTDTSTASINTQILRNEYTSIVSYSNAGKGFLFIGEKDTRFDNLFARNNGSDGFYFKAFKDDSNSLAETTECTITALLSRDNGGNGFVFDMVEKYSAGTLQSAINGGAGFSFKSTVTGAAANGSNSLLCGTIISRNDAQGGFKVDNTAYVYALEIGSVLLYGYNSTLNYPGMIIQGGQNMNFGNVMIQGFNGTGCYIQNGNPFGGGTVESNNIHFDRLRIYANGNASASSNAGLVILNNSYDITINDLSSSNTQTNATTGEYEFAVNATAGPVYVGFAHLQAATSGYEENIGLSETYITTYKHRSEQATITLYDGITAPTTNLTRHAQLFVDGSDGDFKIRFSDGTVKTIVTD